MDFCTEDHRTSLSNLWMIPKKNVSGIYGWIVQNQNPWKIAWKNIWRNFWKKVLKKSDSKFLEKLPYKFLKKKFREIPEENVKGIPGEILRKIDKESSGEIFVTLLKEFLYNPGGTNNKDYKIFWEFLDSNVLNAYISLSQFQKLLVIFQIFLHYISIFILE